MIAALDLIGRRCLAWPLALVGLALTLIAEGMIRASAWLVGIDPNNEDQTL